MTTESIDWGDEVLFHVDLSPGVQTHVRTLDRLLALRSTCKRATLAIVFKPMVAKKLLDEHGTDMCYHAVHMGDLPLLQFAVRRGCPTFAVCTEAANAGHLEILEWAHEHGWCPWDEGTCRGAACNGHLKCLTYAHEHGCPWDERTCEGAAAGGQLECLTYAREHRCPWNEGTCRGAACGGHLECLTYAHEHGCPWDEGTCRGAAMGGPCYECTSCYECTCRGAADGGHVECLTYAREHGCPWDEATCRGAASNHRLRHLV